MVVRFIFFSVLQIWYVEVWISRSISESPLDFEITRIDCITLFFIIGRWMIRVLLGWFINKYMHKKHLLMTLGSTVKHSSESAFEHRGIWCTWPDCSLKSASRLGNSWLADFRNSIRCWKKQELLISQTLVLWQVLVRFYTSMLTSLDWLHLQWINISFFIFLFDNSLK